MDDDSVQNMITSKEVLEKTGISRATLNNYIKMGILPKPVVQKAGEELEGTKHIGYFPDSVIWRIDLVKRLKQEGESMERIAKQFSRDSRVVDMFPQNGPDGDTSQRRPPASEMPEASAQPRMAPSENTAPARDVGNDESEPMQRTGAVHERTDLSLTISDLDMPAYLVNHNFEVEWINKEAEEQIFHRKIGGIAERDSRNIFKLFFGLEFHSNIANWKDVVSQQMEFLRPLLSRDALSNLYPGMSDAEYEFLRGIYEAAGVESREQRAMGPAALKLVKKSGDAAYFQVHCMRFREGTFFVFVPGQGYRYEVMQYLSKRERVIRDLLKNRMPALVSLCVLVADLQDSVKISAELLPGEYFALINSLWESLAGCFEQYGGIYGKHAGDGMLYYFIKKPGSDYIKNSIDCAVELRKRMKKFSAEWKVAKGWLEDMYLNIGMNEGQEFFGTIRSAPTLEFTALGDSINYAGRLSDFARHGEIWTTKSLIGKLDSRHVENIQFGVNKRIQGRTIFTPNGFSRVIDLMDQEDHNYKKFLDIATLPITQIMDVTDI